ncbi:MAG: lipid II flippase MurJ [Bdellovibrionota bacterium]
MKLARTLYARYQSVLAQGLFLSVGLLLGRLSGFAREWMVARKLSVSGDADSFILALAFPDLLNNFISTATLAVALYPLFREGDKADRELLRSFSSVALKLAGVGYVALAVLVTFSYGKQPELAGILLLSLLAVFPNVISAIAAALLQFHGKVRAQGLSTLVFNLVILVGLLLFSRLPLLVFFILLAALARLAFLAYDAAPLVAQRGEPDRSETRVSFPAVGITLATAVAAQILSLATPFLDRFFASYGASGSVAALSYAEKLYMLPGTVVLTVLPYVATPDVFRLASDEGSKERLRTYVRDILAIAFGLGAAATAALYLLATPFTGLVFGSAGLSTDALAVISGCVRAYSGTLLFLGPLGLLSTVFLALGLRRELLVISVSCLLLKLALAYGCVLNGLGPQAIAFTTSILSAVATIAYGFALTKSFATPRRGL